MTRLEKFLINRGLLETFLYNMEHHRTRTTSFQTLMRTNYQNMLIQAAFTWNWTPQRHDFWMNIDREWCQSIKDGTL